MTSTSPAAPANGGIHYGLHCTVPGCNRLDFLPFACHLCNGFYCDTHTKFIHHINCTGIRDNTVISCPVCSKPIPGATTLTSHIEVNNLISDHIDAGCADPNAGAKERKRAKQCDAILKSNSRCNANALTQCRDCGGQFCAKHRFYADHQCTNGANSQAGKGSTAPSVLSSRTGSAAQSRVVSAHSSPRITGGTFAASVQAGLPNGRTSEGAANKAPLPVVCPICHKNVDGANTSMSSSQVNQIVTRHIDAGCPQPKKSGLLGWLGI